MWPQILPFKHAPAIYTAQQYEGVSLGTLNMAHAQPDRSCTPHNGEKNRLDCIGYIENESTLYVDCLGCVSATRNQLLLPTNEQTERREGILYSGCVCEHWITNSKRLPRAARISLATCIYSDWENTPQQLPNV